MNNGPVEVTLRVQNVTQMMTSLDDAVDGAEGSTLLALRELRHEIGRQVGWPVKQPGQYAVVKARLWKGHEDTWVRIGDHWFNSDGDPVGWSDLIVTGTVRNGIDDTGDSMDGTR